MGLIREAKMKGKLLTPKGHVPILVGEEFEFMERIDVHVNALKDPCMHSLLEMARQDFGYPQQGIITIHCHAKEFRWIVNQISKAA